MKEWDKLSRHEKRRQRIKIPDVEKTVPVLEYIRALGAKLPKTVIKSTNAPIDHSKELMRCYLKNGVEGLNNYVAMINEVISDKVKALQEENLAAIEAEKVNE